MITVLLPGNNFLVLSLIVLIRVLSYVLLWLIHVNIFEDIKITT